jgi:hypothetical protein
MLRWGMILMALPLLLLVGLYTLEVQAVVACESDGGVYDFVKGVCEASGPTVFVSFAARHPWLVNIGMLLALAGTCMTTLGMIKKGMAHPKDD